MPGLSTRIKQPYQFRTSIICNLIDRKASKVQPFPGTLCQFISGACEVNVWSLALSIKTRECRSMSSSIPCASILNSIPAAYPEIKPQNSSDLADLNSNFELIQHNGRSRIVFRW